MRTTIIVLGIGLAWVWFAPAAGAADDSPACSCWYRGYEDAAEVKPGQKPESAWIADCTQSGNGNAYTAGFDARASHVMRRCPL